MSTNTGDNIKTLRKFYGETQEELGSSINVSGAAISYFENDQRSPDIEMIKNIAQHYGVTLDQLIGSDLTAIRNIGTFPEYDVDLSVLLRTAFPFTTTQTDNKFFNNGYRTTDKIMNSIKNNMPVMESMIDFAVSQFEKSIEETQMPQAKVNYLLMLILKWDSLRSDGKKVSDKEAVSSGSLKVDQEFMKKNYLDRDRSFYKEEAKRKEAFIEEYGKIIIEKTRELKDNDDWRDFAEFYQALRYLADMVNIRENSTQYNLNTGIEQMISLVLMGNKYAIAYVSQKEQEL